MIKVGQVLANGYCIVRVLKEEGPIYLSREQLHVEAISVAGRHFNTITHREQLTRFLYVEVPEEDWLLAILEGHYEPRGR